MAVEIERKFLVCGDGWRDAPAVYYSQGYLNRDRERTVRVRVANQRGFITIKGKNHGAVRAEFEYEIPVDEATQLLALCEGPLIEKYRRNINYAGMLWEVDEFLGDNFGLIVAEIELADEKQDFDLPEWVGKEVTNDARYYNSNLSITPYKTW